MFYRYMLFISFGFLLILSGCTGVAIALDKIGSPKSSPREVPKSSSRAEYGICEYGVSSVNYEKIFAWFSCKEKMGTDENGTPYYSKISLICKTLGKYGLREMNIYLSGTEGRFKNINQVKVEYRFDDSPPIGGFWDVSKYGVLSSGNLGHAAAREFTHELKTAKNLTFSSGEYTSTFDLTDVGEGAAVFDEDCNEITSSKL